MNRKRRLNQTIQFLIFITLLAWLASTAHAQREDVTFLVIGKHANFAQQADGELQPVDYSFFSEIFFTDNGDAENAFLSMPTGERLKFRDQRVAPAPDTDNLLLISGAKRFVSYEELLSWYPDGAYNITFDSPSGSVDSGALSFPQNGLPNAPLITLRQAGKMLCGIVDPAKDVQVSWSEFEQGSADQNGILDDLIFVILEDASGERVSHSGRPFEGKPFLTYADKKHDIAAAAMSDGQEYTLSVEHAILTDTKRLDGVPAMTTYAVTSKLKFETRTDSNTNCGTREDSKGTSMSPSTDAQVVMFYYKDLADVDRFYGEALGLNKTLDDDWVKFYATSPTSTVGLVKESEGAWHDVREKNSVMLSIVTAEVDAWYNKLKRDKSIVFLKEIGDGGPIRSFLIEDPGGYTVEFFQWL